MIAFFIGESTNNAAFSFLRFNQFPAFSALEELKARAFRNFQLLPEAALRAVQYCSFHNPSLLFYFFNNLLFKPANTAPTIMPKATASTIPATALTAVKGLA